jgi:hypothetical protein
LLQGAGAGRLGGLRAGIPLQDDVLRIILGMVFRCGFVSEW